MLEHKYNNDLLCILLITIFAIFRKKIVLLARLLRLHRLLLLLTLNFKVINQEITNTYLLIYNI